MTKYFLLVAAISSLVLTSCAWTEETSFRDPDFQSTKYSHLMIFVGIENLQAQKNAELAFRKELRKVGFEGDVTLALEAMPPTRTYSNEEVLEIERARHIDGILFVSLESYGVEKSYVPPSYESSTSGAAKPGVFGGVTYSQKTTVNQVGGYDINKPWASFKTTMIDFASGKNAWLATSRSNGNGFASFNTVVHSQAEETVRRLVLDGVVSASSKNSLGPW